jgi:hypothetical protein
MFDAARDLVFTNSADGQTIMSGGYRIKKLFGTAKNKHGGGKRKNKKEYHEDEFENLYKENYGIPMGLLFLSPKFHVEQQEQQQKVYAPAHENDNASAAATAIGELELVISPQQSQLIISDDYKNCMLKEDATQITSNEVDPELFQILLNNTVTDHNNNHSHVGCSRRVTKKRNANIDNDNLKNEKLYKKIYMRRKTRKHNNN